MRKRTAVWMLVAFFGAVVGIPAQPRPSPPALVPEGELLRGAATLLDQARLRSPLAALAWSPDGKRIAVGAEDGTVVLWQVATGREVKRFQDNSRAVLSLAWSGDGRRLATTSDSGIARIWDLEGPQDPVRIDGWSVAWSPDGQLALGFDDGTVEVWDPQTGKHRPFPGRHQERVSTLAWSPDGTLLATGSLDRTVRVWQNDGAPVSLLDGHEERINAVAWSPFDALLVSGSSDGTVRIWDAMTGEEVRIYEKHRSAVHSVDWAPDGRMLASASRDGTIRTWHLFDSEELGLLEGHGGEVRSIAFSPASRLLAAGSRDGQLRVWTSASGDEIRQLGGQVDPVAVLAFDAKGAVLAVGSAEGPIRLWQLEGNSPGAPPPWIFPLVSQGRLLSLAVSSGGRTLAAGFDDGRIDLWRRSDDGNRFNRLSPFPELRSPVRALAFSPDRSTLAAGYENGSVRMWDLASHQEVLSLDQQNAILTIAWSPDGRALATGSRDRFVRLWNLDDKIEVGSSRLRDVVLHVAFLEAEPPVGRADGVRVAPPRPLQGDDTLIVVLLNGTVELRSPASNEGFTPLQHSPRRLSAAAFSADGGHLASAEFGSGVVRVEEVRQESLHTTRRLLGGVRDNWVDCRADDRCWRYDGSLLTLENDAGEFEPIPPQTSTSPPGLEVVSSPSSLSLNDEQAVPVNLKIRNPGPGWAYWINATARSDSFGEHITFHPPPTIVALPPGAETELLGEVSAHSAYDDPQPARQPLELTVSSANASSLVLEPVLVESSAPSLDWVEAQLSLTGSTVSVTLINDGAELFTADYWTARIVDNELGPFPAEIHLESGEKETLDFDVPASLEGESPENVSVSIYKTRRPAHRWVFRDMKIRQPPVPLEILGALAIVVVLAVLISLSFALRRWFPRRRRGEVTFLAWAGGAKHAHLALVFTDILDSTKLAASLPGVEWSAIRNAHFEQANRLIRQLGGYRIKTTGDGLFVAFRNVMAALDFAVGIEHDTGHENIQIRAGVHQGQIEVDRNDAHGKVVHMTSRVMDQARTGGVLASDLVKHHYEDTYGQDGQYSWGEQPGCELKGFDGRFTLWSVEPRSEQPGDPTSPESP